MGLAISVYAEKINKLKEEDYKTLFKKTIDNDQLAKIALVKKMGISYEDLQKIINILDEEDIETWIDNHPQYFI